MRKTSHDGLDSTSVTSGLENEIKKSGQGILKSKKNSIKRKVPNFSHESDDGIIQPLLETDKDKTDIANRSAKYLLAKTKTDSISEVDDLNIVSENVAILSAPTPISTTNKISTSHIIKDFPSSTSNAHGAISIQNQKPNNIYREGDAVKATDTTRNSVLVELEGSKITTYHPSPLIFTTAKIHTESKTKLMDPVPISSTIKDSGKSGVTGNTASENFENRDLEGKKHEQLLYNTSKESTSKEMLSLTDFKNSNNGFQIASIYSDNKIVTTKSDLNHIMKTDNNTNLTKCLSNDKEPLPTLGLSTTLNKKHEFAGENKEFDSKRLAKSSNDESGSQGQKSYETLDKQFSTLSKSNSKKLQRQKKTTVDDLSNSDIKHKDKTMNNFSINTNSVSSLSTKESIPTLSSIQSQVATCYAVTPVSSVSEVIKQTSVQPYAQVSLSKNKSPLSPKDTLSSVASISSKLLNESNMSTIIPSDEHHTTSIMKKQTILAKEVESSKKPTVSTILPSYIVPTSKTKIGATLVSNTSAFVSKPEIYPSTPSTIGTHKEAANITTSSVAPRENKTTTAEEIVTKVTATGTKIITTAKPQEVVAKTSNTAITCESARKTTSLEPVSKISSSVMPREPITKTTSTVTSREATTKNTSSIASREEAAKMSTPQKPVTITMSTVSPSDLLAKTTGTVKSPEAVTKSSSSTATPREVKSKTICNTVTPQEMVKKTISSSVTPRESGTKTTSTVTPHEVVTKTSIVVKPHVAETKIISTATLRGAVVPISCVDSKPTKNASLDEIKQSSDSQQSKSKIETHNKDRA